MSWLTMIRTTPRITLRAEIHKELMAELMREDVQIELCGATAKENHWGNANLLPGVKANTNAMVRLTQLEQEGYQMIYEKAVITM